MDRTLIEDLLHEYLAEPLEGTIFTPDAFTTASKYDSRSGITHVDIRGAPGWNRFDLLHDEGICANGYLHVQSALRGTGIGSALVTVHEHVCEENGIERIIIGKNNDDEFWRKRGYGHATQVNYYRALAAIGRIRYDEARFSKPREKVL